MMKVPLLIGLLGLIATPLWAAHSHCKINEKIVFSCSLEKSEKIISICASSNFSVENGYLQYRFGKQDKVELTLPASKHEIKPSSQTIRAKSLMFSGGGGSYLRFTNSPYDYIVYSAIGKSWGPKDGVAVEKNQRLLAYWECRDAPITELSQDFFLQSGLLIDNDEFVIPGTDK